MKPTKKNDLRRVLRWVAILCVAVVAYRSGLGLFGNEIPNDGSTHGADAVHSQARNSSSGSAIDRDLHLILLNETGLSLSSRCLDGSSPGFYYRRAAPHRSRSWLLVFEGGAWCYSDDSCAFRSGTRLGSTTRWARVLRNPAGILSASGSSNPRFSDWNVVFFGYCDGGSFMGQAERTADAASVDDFNVNQVEGVAAGRASGRRRLFMHGWQIAEDILHVVSSRFGFQQADEVLVSGTSAGAVAASLHIDTIRRRFPATVRVRGLADAAFFHDIPSVEGTFSTVNLFDAVVQYQNISRLPAACVAAVGARDHRCFLPNTHLPYVTTPTLYTTAVMDTWVLRNVIAPSKASAAANAVRGQSPLPAVARLADRPPLSVAAIAEWTSCLSLPPSSCSPTLLSTIHEFRRRILFLTFANVTAERDLRTLWAPLITPAPASADPADPTEPADQQSPAEDVLFAEDFTSSDRLQSASKHPLALWVDGCYAHPARCLRQSLFWRSAPQHAVYVSSCITHSLTWFDSSWAGVRVADSSAVRDVVAKWWDHRLSSGAHPLYWIDCMPGSGGETCNSDCTQHHDIFRTEARAYWHEM